MERDLPDRPGAVITKEGLDADDYLFAEHAQGGNSTPPPGTDVAMVVRILRKSDVDHKRTATVIDVALGSKGWFARNKQSESPFHQNKENRLPMYKAVKTGVQPYAEYLVPGYGGARIVVDLASNKVYLSYHYGDASAKSGKFPKWVLKLKKQKMSPFVELDPNTWDLKPLIADALAWWGESAIEGDPGT